MTDETKGSPPGALSLPDKPDLEWLRKQAKRRLSELQVENPSAQLADAQFDLAKQYGFTSWRALKAHIDALTIDGKLFDAARSGDTAALAAVLDASPDKLYVRDKPYEWTLLRAAAHHGRLAAVNLLLARGLDVNVREKGDNTYAMHWAAAAGHVDVVNGSPTLAATSWEGATPRAGGHRLGDVLGWVRRRCAPRRVGRAPRTWSPASHLLRDRDGARG